MFAMCFPSFAAIATWYNYGKITANGEHFNPNGMTAAHRTFPFGTLVKVKHGNKSVIVRINDRGPFVPGHDIDLTPAAASAINCKTIGRCPVTLEIVH